MGRFRQFLKLVFVWSMIIGESSSNSWTKRPHFPDTNVRHYRPTRLPSWTPPPPSPVTVASPPPPPPPTKCLPHYTTKEVSFNFSNLGLTNIGADFIQSTDLVSLDLTRNKIRNVSPLAFRRAPYVQILDFSGNMIPVKKLLWFNNVLNLRTLVITDTNSSAEPDWTVGSEYLSRMSQLRELSLDRNHIREFKVELKTFAPLLTYLSLSENRISSTDFLKDLPSTVQHLSLDRNLIEQIDGELLVNIVQLDLHWNRIEKLCGTDCSDSSLSLSKATKLEKLDLSGNRISDVPEDAFKELVKLTELNLSNNSIVRLVNGTFEAQSRLEELLVSHNKLVQIPDLCPLKNLKVLDLSHNEISEVDGKRFCKASMLKTVLLNNNRIFNVQAFDVGTSLHILELSHNLLSGLPDNWIAPSNSPVVLALNNNNITDWDRVSLNVHMHRMLELHLQENPLVSVSIKHMCNYPRNLLIHLKIPSVEEELAEVEEVEEVKNGSDDDSNSIW